ncbi:hypothetical protein RHECNPAF_200014 [Rhizobium etli CNPAF512]|nr:hypothetical protein RHECNPAF_200014 [Rhizobium etli CNPAF512]
MSDALRMLVIGRLLYSRLGVCEFNIPPNVPPHDTLQIVNSEHLRAHEEKVA